LARGLLDPDDLDDADEHRRCSQMSSFSSMSNPGPRVKRTASFQFRVQDSEMERQLGRVQWFNRMPLKEIRILMRRARHREVCGHALPHDCHSELHASHMRDVAVLGLVGRCRDGRRLSARAPRAPFSMCFSRARCKSLPSQGSTCCCREPPSPFAARCACARARACACACARACVRRLVVGRRRRAGRACRLAKAPSSPTAHGARRRS
jgi:hypothetical protein